MHKIWKNIIDYGSLTINDALDFSLVDSQFPLDPLGHFLAENKSEKSNKKWKNIVESLDFQANEKIELKHYNKILRKRKESTLQRKKFDWAKYSAYRYMSKFFPLSSIGLNGPNFNIEKVSNLYHNTDT